MKIWELDHLRVAAHHPQILHSDEARESDGGIAAAYALDPGHSF